MSQSDKLPAGISRPGTVDRDQDQWTGTSGPGPVDQQWASVGNAIDFQFATMESKEYKKEFYQNNLPSTAEHPSGCIQSVIIM